jgi:hypothetical protein
MPQKQAPIIFNPRRPLSGNGTQSTHTLSGGLDEHEKISVRALIAYAAMNTGKREEEIGRRVCERFAAANIDHLPSRTYEDVIRFLVDLCDGGAQ